MKRRILAMRWLLLICWCLGGTVAFDSGWVFAATADVAAEEIFAFDDQYVQIEANLFHGENRSTFGIEVRLTPKTEWKLCASDSSRIKPLRLKLSPSKCLKTKGATYYSPPDLAGMDDSGAYSEYFTKTATIKQLFSRLKCPPKNMSAQSITLTYLLCQHNRCVGPFSKEIGLRGLEKK